MLASVSDCTVGEFAALTAELPKLDTEPSKEGGIMNSTTIGLLVLGTVVLVAVVVLLRRAGAKAQGLASAEVTPGTALAVQGELEDGESFPVALHFGADLANPAVKVRPLPLSEMTSLTPAPVVDPSLGLSSKISSLMQAVPSLLVAEAHQGRQLMEVVIDGKLIRAADGNGFRAMAMGPDGIKEHARLFGTKGLEDLVNAAAVWQLASVVVAQKHMADISRKLGEIKDAVNSISDFLDSARRATIEGTYKYLQQAYEVLAQGELSQEIRNELESREVTLLEVQAHLVADVRRRSQIAPRDDDTFGTESLHKNAVAKYRELGQTVEDLRLCLGTRALCWYVLSLYPGAQALKAVRRDGIKEDLQSFRDLKAMIDSQGAIDLARFKSMWNRDKTLDERKNEVLSASRETQALLESARVDTGAQLDGCQTLLMERDAPTQLIVELVDGVVTQVRQRELMAA